MGKSKKSKLSTNKSDSMSENSPFMDQSGSLSGKKKKKSKKGDTSLQSTMNSYISTSTTPKKQIKTNAIDGSKTKVSPIKELIQSPSKECSSVERSPAESLDKSRKRKSNDTSRQKKSKKVKLEHKNVETITNAQSNALFEKESHSEDSSSSSPDVSNTKRAQEQKSNLTPQPAKKKGHYNNVSSDEGVDSSEEIEEDQLNEQQLESGIVSEADWSKQQTEELIFMIEDKIESVKPGDTMSYRCRMKILQWGNLPSLLHPPRTERECKDQLKNIVDNTKTVRNLSEMLRAFKNKPFKKKKNKPSPLIPFRRFYLEHADEIKKMKGNVIINARSLYDALSEKERRRYVDAYKDEVAQKNALIPKAARSTFKIFCATLPDDCSKVEEKKKKFLALPSGQRVSLIKQALKEYKQCLHHYEALQQEGEDKKFKPPNNRVTKEEWRLFLENKGMPMLRAISPYQLFLLDHDDSDDDGAKTSLQRYHQFTRSSHHAEYERRFEQELEEFGRKFKAWFDSVKDDLWKEPAHAYYSEVTTSKGGVKKKKKITANAKNFKVASKVQELEQSYVESTMVGKFSDEPVAAPFSAREVFKQFAMAKNPNTTKNDINNAWAHLPKAHKEKFLEVAGNNMKEYKTRLKNFVKNLPDHEQRVYIGQNRVRFIRVFEGTDIFEKDYPCVEYPPFRTPVKNEKKSPKKSDSNSKLDLDIRSMFEHSTTNGLDGEDSDSEEEMELPKKEKSFSEESFKGLLPSTSTPAIVTGKGTHSANHNKQQESDSESSSESSDDDANGAGNNSTRYLEKRQKVHPKKLLDESESDDSSDSEEEEEGESSKPTRPPNAGRSPAAGKTTPKQPAANGAGGESSSSEEETSSSSSDEAKMSNSPNKSSPHGILPLKKTPHQIAAQRQAESSSSESSSSEEESAPKMKTVAKPTSGRKKPSIPPPEEDSSSEDDDIETAWA